MSEPTGRELVEANYARLEADHAQLVALVKALPLAEGDICICKTPCGKADDDFVWCVESDLANGETWDHGTFDTEPGAQAYAALLTYRKALGAPPVADQPPMS